MMSRRLLLVAALVGGVLLGMAPAASADGGSTPFHFDEVTVAELLADPEAYDGVIVRGELVGDFGVRDDGTVWTQLNGDAYVEAPIPDGGRRAGANVGIGVRIPAELWPGFDRPGGYRTRGPVVELQGIWRFHDPARGGESYLDVTGLELLEAPRVLGEGVDWLSVGVGAGLLAAAGALAWLTRRRRG